MKRNKILLLITAVILFASISVRQFVNEQTGIVDVYTVYEEAVENTIVCSGTVEYCREYPVQCDDDIIIDEVFKEEGESVRAGELLFTGKSAVVETAVPKISEDELYQAIISGDFSVLSKQQTVATPSTKGTSSVGKDISVYAVYSGVVTELSHKSGDAVTNGTALAVIAPIDDLQVILNVNEAQICDIKVGQKAEITGTGFKGVTYQGTVKSIAPEAKISTTGTGKATTVAVTVSIDNADSKIKSGFTAKCCITTSKEENCVVLPYEYICCDNSGREYVYIYNNGFALKRFITTGAEYINGVKVDKGLCKGDQVITNPQAVGIHGRVIKSDKAGV